MNDFREDDFVMMKFLKSQIFAPIIIFFIVITIFVMLSHNNKNGTSPADSFYLTNAELNQNKEKAIKGDSDSIYKLYMFYDVYMTNFKEADKWLVLAVEHNFNWSWHPYGLRQCEMGNIQEGARYLIKACKNLNDKTACEDAKYCRNYSSQNKRK